MKFLIIENFDNLIKAIRDKLAGKGFEIERYSKESCLFCNEKNVYKVELCAEDCKVYLYWKNKEGDIGEDWVRSAAWLFETPVSSNDINMICEDFVDVMDNNKRLAIRPKRKKEYSEKSADALFFANRLANIFPELRKEIFIEKEAYKEFRGSVFVEKNVLPKVLEVLSLENSDKKAERMLKLLSDLYKNSSLNIRSLIMMGIMKQIVKEEHADKVKKYTNEEFCKAWVAAGKFKDKKFVSQSKSKIKSILQKF